ncbi:MAG: pyridoxamine 5'-phosphate oxidase family protein [Candidatus Acidiferrales bacterium]
MDEPRASRPFIPNYGVADATGGKGLLPWSWARERLERAHNYWIATMRPEGAPHVMPIWGLWADESFYFSTDRSSRKFRNLLANPKCVVCPENAAEAVMVEGEFTGEVKDAAVLEQLAEIYKKKYDWDVKGFLFYGVQPRVLFGFIETNSDFTKTATRWNFSNI